LGADFWGIGFVGWIGFLVEEKKVGVLSYFKR
jgi:hypothetical protein